MKNPPPARSARGDIKAFVDGLLPPAAQHLPHVERWRLRMAMATSLFIAFLVMVEALIRSWVAEKLVFPVGTLIGLLVFGGSTIAPRLLGTVRLPTVVLSFYPMVSQVVFSLENPTLTMFSPLSPLLGGFFGGRLLAVIGTLVGVAELLVIGGPLSTELPPHALASRMNTIYITVVVGGVIYLSDRFLLETDRERNEAREEALRLTREQARQLRHQALRVAAVQALAGTESLAEALQRCCDAVARHLGPSSVGVWLLDETGKALELSAAVGEPPLRESPHVRVGLEQPGLGQVASQQESSTFGPEGGEPMAEPEWLKRTGVVASAAVPLVLGERRVGVLAAYARQPLPEDAMVALSVAADPLAQGVERKRAESALAQRAEELARSNRDLEQFAYVASHDLQEPLRMVGSYTQLLSRRYRDRLDGDANDFIGFVVDGVDRMQRLIRDLLQYSRVTSQRKEPVPVDTEQLVQQSLADLKARIEETGATVTHDALPVVPADDVQLRQLFQNLLSNALKFRRPDVSPRVHVSAALQGEEWIFSVRDNGIGIAPEQFNRLFVLFQRLHSQSEYPGTGIGLALCKRIVESHGGQIRLESQSGQGTTFIFTLPAHGRALSNALPTLRRAEVSAPSR